MMSLYDRMLMMSLYDRSFDSCLRDIGYWRGDARGNLFTVTDLDAGTKDGTRRGYKITCDMPGVRKENVKVNISSSGVITIDAKRLDTSGLTVKTYHYESTGIYSGEKIIAKGVVSQLRDGVLTITVPVRPVEDEDSVSVETT